MSNPTRLGTSGSSTLRRAFGLMCLLVATAAGANDVYPNKPIQIIVPYPPGGAADTTARLVGKGLSEVLGQPVIVDNRAGAGGVVGTMRVVNAAPDGYTLLLGNPGPNAILPSLNPEAAKYDVIKDFTPVAVLMTTPYFITVPQASPFTSLKDLIGAAKTKGAKSLNYGSTGNGGVSHLGSELFKAASGIDSVHVQYKGTAPLTLAVLSNEVDWAMLTAMDAGTHIEAGKLRYLAATSASRSPLSPNIPTLQELGYKDFEVTVWYGLLAPRNTPRPIIDTLHAALQKVMAKPDIDKALRDTRGVPSLNTPDQFSALIQADFKKYAEVLKRAEKSPANN